MLDLIVPKKVTPCRVRTIYKKLTKDEQAVFTKALENHAFSARDLAKALQDQGYGISANPIWRHRNENCSCWNT